MCEHFTLCIVWCTTGSLLVCYALSLPPPPHPPPSPQILNPLCVRDAPAGDHSTNQSLSQVTNLSCDNVSWDPTLQLFGCLLKWVNSSNSIDPMHHTNVYLQVVDGDDKNGGFRFIGRSHCDRFAVIRFPLPPTAFQVDVAIQMVCLSRRKLPVDKCPFVRVKFTNK